MDKTDAGAQIQLLGILFQVFRFLGESHVDVGELKIIQDKIEAARKLNEEIISICRLLQDEYEYATWLLDCVHFLMIRRVHN